MRSGRFAPTPQSPEGERAEANDAEKMIKHFGLVLAARLNTYIELFVPVAEYILHGCESTRHRAAVSTALERRILLSPGPVTFPNRESMVLSHSKHGKYRAIPEIPGILDRSAI